MTTSTIILPSIPPTPTGSPKGFTIRARRPEDMPQLCDLLGRQQPGSKYPIVWPLPMPVPEFIEREGEVAAFVAEKADTNHVVGHVSVCRLVTSDHIDDGLGPTWAAAYGCKEDQLRIIGVLFTDPTFAGKGVGSALMDAATELASSGNNKAALDCLDTNVTALNFYLRRGWKIIGEWRDAPWLPAGSKSVVHLLILDEDKAKVRTNGAGDGAVENGRQ